ncbi:endoplasmic reticulum metallopeptidase 1 [Nomia melanderi]|uniref:endoplasmic reticulum metallopeptidase 1 n=1 Tax=Nomia melanderi TaxID=2448451 RepID=UPI0013041413|nr:endoplasmic reticulum metallopeptidase 1-like [Nomia melanderi]XP_031849003.1 endoplasmic reticulum metallopeptidase 1-like [Nomia melanderi]XP_031849004.1 endoplasmic reticulum metallopeptidase 1-like [Nomia melanderi]XP_031849005.1 endoplasmic reticulum metallopeptidase 1-like [Nomia melanderi]
MRDGIRFRQHVSKRASGDILYEDKASLKRKEVLPNESQHLFFLFTFFLLISIAIIAFEKKLPEPITLTKEGLYPGRFIAERARNHLVNLTSIGPRIVGSYENEVLAIKYLTNIINNIVKDASENHKILVNVTKHSGAFPLKFLDGMTNVYKNVQNIIVKIGPHMPMHSSVLLNCHFDTFPDSPGGSDDGAGCAVMLEILRVIAHSSKLLKHNIIFLFNGAEENLMQASHGFITQHAWAKEIRAFINLEACGAGGRELLFQAGPDSSWLLQVYSKSVPYPYASSLAQEIFESGIVPGDTDFRIFRDFGNVSGLDFAWSTNGYVYHTKFDNIDQIPLGSLQRTGDNILALLQGIVLDSNLSEAIQNNPGNLVFFDFLGAFVIRWPQYMASTINVVSIIVGVCSIYLNAHSARRDVKKSTYVKHILLCIGAIIVSWLLSIISCTMIALVLTKLGKVMSWYGRPAWLFFLYVCPTIFVSMMFFLFVGLRQKKEVKSAWILFQVYSDAYSIIWMLILFCCVVFEIRSGFIPLHWVVFPTLGNLLRYNFFNKWRGWKWLFYYLTTMCIPYMQSFYLVIGALYLFIPIMGRSGGNINSEVVMANTLSILFCLLLSFSLPVVLLIKNAKQFLYILIEIFLISIGALFLTRFGFPYSGNLSSLAPERFMIAHAQRQYYDVNGNLRHSGTGYWIADLDMNSPHSVEAMVPEITAATSTMKDCEHELYCGLPYFMPVTTFLSKTSWIPGPAPLVNIPTKLDLVSKSIKQNIVTFTFNVTGPDHISIILSPYKGVHLERWSILEGNPLQGPKWNDRETYFVYYSCASDCIPYTFSIELNVPFAQKTPCLSVALGGHFLHGKHQKSLRFKRFLAQFPSWTVVTPWTATYTSWQF